MYKMNCPKCNAELIRVEVKIDGAMNKAVSYQCQKNDCFYYEFEKSSAKRVIEEIKKNPNKPGQRIEASY